MVGNFLFQAFGLSSLKREQRRGWHGADAECSMCLLTSSSRSSKLPLAAKRHHIE